MVTRRKFNIRGESGRHVSLQVDVEGDGNVVPEISNDATIDDLVSLFCEIHKLQQHWLTADECKFIEFQSKTIRRFWSLCHLIIVDINHRIKPI
jgi:hypothetical protein